MGKVTETDGSASALARRALGVTSGLAFAGSALGVVAIGKGTLAGFEAALIFPSLLISCGTLALLFFRKVDLQTIATVVTLYFGVHLCACSIFALSKAGNPHNLFIYLVWFFPLLVFNKMVNSPAIGRVIARILFLAPLLLVGCFFPRTASPF